MHEHAGSTLNQWLEDEGRNLVGATTELVLETLQSGCSIGSSWTRDRDAAREERTENPMEQLDSTDADRAERVAVIGVAESKELLFRLPTSKLPVLERLLESDLDCCRTGVRVKHSRQRARSDLEL